MSVTEPATLCAEIETRLLRKFVEPLALCRNTCGVDVTEEGLSARVNDPPNIHVVDAELPASAFETFYPGGESTGLPVEWLAETLQRADAETARLSITEETVEVAAGGLEASNPTASADGSGDVPDIASALEGQTASATITGLQFRRGIQEADSPEDVEAVEITTASHPTEVQFLFWDEWCKSVLDEEVFGEDRAQALDVDEHGSASYSVWYLGAIAETITASPPVTLRFAEDWPLSIRYPLVGAWSDDELGHVEHVLAPRIPKEDLA